ncbi:Protein Dopey-2 [Manis pentadactyla]|nr:Protein Dopey-2 [Manis pentadactyla]
MESSRDKDDDRQRQICSHRSYPGSWNSCPCGSWLCSGRLLPRGLELPAIRAHGAPWENLRKEKAEGDLIGTRALGEAYLLDTRANNQRLNDKKGLRCCAPGSCWWAALLPGVGSEGGGNLIPLITEPGKPIQFLPSNIQCPQTQRPL